MYSSIFFGILIVTLILLVAFFVYMALNEEEREIKFLLDAARSKKQGTDIYGHKSFPPRGMRVQPEVHDFFVEVRRTFWPSRPRLIRGENPRAFELVDEEVS